MIIKSDELLDMLGRLTEALYEYNEITNRLTVADIEEPDEVELILSERETVKQALEAARVRVSEITDEQEDEKAKLIRQMLLGETIMTPLDDTERKIMAYALDLKSLQGEILKKDETFNKRFNQKYTEIKTNMQELQKDKKRLDYYSAVSGNAAGTGFKA